MKTIIITQNVEGAQVYRKVMRHVQVLLLLQTATRHFEFSSQTLIFFFSFENCPSDRFPCFLVSVLFSSSFPSSSDFFNQNSLFFLSFSHFFIILLQHVILVVSSFSNSSILPFFFFYFSPSTIFAASPLPPCSYLSFMFTIEYICCHSTETALP